MISFVYFDVGGVAVFDFSGNNKWHELKTELGIAKEHESGFTALWSRYYHELCIGRDVDTLVPILRQELGLPLPDDYSLLHGFVSRFEKNPALWPVVAAIKKQVPVGLLTNMYPRMLDSIIAAAILPPATWDTVVDSSVEGCQKPDSAIFERAQAKAGVPKEHIFFVDNSEEHVAAAIKFGFQAFLYDPTAPETAGQALLRYFEHHK